MGRGGVRLASLVWCVLDVPRMLLRSADRVSREGKNMRAKRFGWFTVLVVGLMVSIPGWAQPWSGIIAPSRAIDWSRAGVAGGIPTRTTICATLNPGASAAQIESAISSCPANQVVFLNAGTYNLTSGITFGAKSDVTLRGAGANATFLVFSNDDGCHGFSSSICLDSSDTNWKGGMSNSANWTAGYARGTTTITLSAVPNLKVGNPINLDQTDDTIDAGAIIVTDTKSTLGSASPGIAGPFSLEGNGGGAQRSGRMQMQIVTVTSCDGNSTVGHVCSSGTNITIEPGLYMPNWSGSRSPQAWWATSPIRNSGIENMSLDHTAAGGAGVEIFNCVGCFVKGVRSIDTGRAHVQLQYSARATVRDNYFFLTQNSVSQSYGIDCYSGNDSLVENNIFQAIASPLMINAPCSGTVLGYNFTINNYYTGASRYSLAGHNLHMAGTDFLLLEGNNTNQVYGDVFHGTHHFGTYFRNRFTGPQPACWQSGSTYATATFNTCTNNASPVVLESFTRFMNFVGNVLGTSGTNTTYGNVWDVGGGNSNGSVTVPNDPNVAPTLLRWGNCDSATGFSSCKFDSAEIPSGLSGTQAPYSSAVPASQIIPASFYLNAKPSWFRTTPFPAMGPDVSGGNMAGVGGRANLIPAQDCFLNVMHGPSDGTGGVLSFSASDCYGSGAGQVSSVPAPPSNLTVLVQ